MEKKIKVVIFNKTLYACIVVLIFWYLFHLVVNSSVIPSPYKTIAYFISNFPGVLSLHLLVSLSRMTAAVIISLLAGSLIGVWVGMSKRADEFISPIVYLFYPLPKIAFLPIIMILFGLGDTSKIVLIVSIIIFQFILAARDGVKEISRELFYSVASLGLSKFDMYKHLIIPAVMPKIMTALRIGVGVSISVLFIGENFATTYGIGYFIMNSWIMADYVSMFSGILALSILGLLIYGLIDILERWIVPGARHKTQDTRHRHRYKTQAQDTK
jgi:NitT/TauT family transport system permease protein